MGLVLPFFAKQFCLSVGERVLIKTSVREIFFYKSEENNLIFPPTFTEFATFY